MNQETQPFTTTQPSTAAQPFTNTQRPPLDPSTTPEEHKAAAMEDSRATLEKP